MNKLLTFALIAIFYISISTSYAKIWRVNNHPGITADYTTAQAAHDGAAAGDTIYLEHSQTSYGNVTLEKKLIIIGTGFFLDQNPQTQWNYFGMATLGIVTFSSNSDFSQLMGVTCTGNLNINAPNITIRRNYIRNEIHFSASYIIFTENYWSFVNPYNNYDVIYCLYLDPSIHDLVFSNNIIVLSSSYYYVCVVSITGSVAYNGIFYNNIVSGYNGPACGQYCKLDINNFDIRNNILTTCSFVPNYNTYSFNISDNSGFGNQNGNQQNVSMSAVFINSGSSDGKYQLKDGSLAIGAGMNGVDCGAFGGTYPYILSGMPPIPAIYDFMIGNNSSQFNVNLKAKSHN